MANGVGFLPGLPGSIPGIPSPRRSDPSDAGSRPPTRSSDRVDERSTRIRSGGTTAGPRPQNPGTPARPPRSRVVVPGSPDRKDPSIAESASKTQRAGATPLSASIHRIRVSSPSLLRLSLRPAALGEVRIELSVHGSAVKARVRTETGEARALILDRLDELREILEGQGLKVSEFRVDVSDAKTEDDIDPVSGRRGAEEVRESGPRSHRRQVLDVRV